MTYTQVFQVPDADGRLRQGEILSNVTYLFPIEIVADDNPPPLKVEIFPYGVIVTPDCDIEAYEPVGCGRCGGSGYKGRTGLYEVMSVSDEIRDLTVERASSEEIRKVAVAQGMRPLRADGFEKVKNGITSIAEVARVT